MYTFQPYFSPFFSVSSFSFVKRISWWSRLSECTIYNYFELKRFYGHRNSGLVRTHVANSPLQQNIFIIYFFHHFPFKYTNITFSLFWLIYPFFSCLFNWIGLKMTTELKIWCFNSGKTCLLLTSFKVFEWHSNLRTIFQLKFANTQHFI